MDMEVQLAADWSAAEDLPLRFVNHFAVQVGGGAGPQHVPDGIYVYVGAGAPPILMGTEEQVRESLAAMGNKYPVEAAARFVMSRERAEELMQFLSVSINQYDEQVKRVRARG